MERLQQRGNRMAKLKKSPDLVSDKLIDAGERLFARYGVAGVSLRQISAEAGTRNNYAVQYHFEDLEGLLRAILEKRALELERPRGLLLSHFTAQGAVGVRQLIECFHRPILELRDDEGSAVYARFLVSLLSTPSGLALLDDVFNARPVARHLLELVVIANEGVPAPITWRRMQFAGIGTLTYCETAFNFRISDDLFEAALADALDMATAAISVPIMADTPIIGEAARYFPLNADPE